MAAVDDVDKLIERFHLARAESVRGHLQREGGSAVVRDTP